MIIESVFLFLLIGTGENVEQHYIGRLNNCKQVEKVIENASKKIKNITGFICIDSQSDLRKRYQLAPTPRQKRIIKDIQEIMPDPMPKPLILKKKNEIN